MIAIPMNAKPPISLAELDRINSSTPPPIGPVLQVQSRSSAPVQPQPSQRSKPPAVSRGVTIRKGEKISLTKINPNLDLIDVGIGWELGPNGQTYDLDVEAFLLGQSGKVIGDDWFVFYNQPVSPDGAVRLLGDNANTGKGDSETMQVMLSKLDPNVSKITFIVTINEAQEKGYNFSNVANAYIRIVDKSTNSELIRFHLTEYYHTVCSMIVGEVYKYHNEWRFNPVGDGTSNNLLGLCQIYGVNVAD